MPKIFLDSGHGGKDSGAVGNGIQEKDIVLDICKRIESGLKKYQNTEVKMSRSTDVFLELSERTKQANLWGADVLVSVHCNASTNASANGFESYVYTNVDSGTVAFQNVLHSEILKAMGSGISNRDKKKANFHMLRESKMKACLTEMLFVSNKTDASKLKDASFRQKIAEGHINGIAFFLGLKKDDRAPEAPVTSPPTTEKLWKVQVGAFAEKENAEALASDLAKQGYRPYIKYE